MNYSRQPRVFDGVLSGVGNSKTVNMEEGYKYRKHIISHIWET